MKVIKRYLKNIAQLFSVLMLLHSCSVYQRSAVSIEEASQTNLKVKIEHKDGTKEKFAHIKLFEDGKYYGHQKIKGEWFKNYILIDANSVKNIQLLDKNASTTWSIIVPVLIVGIIIGVASIAFDRMNAF